VIENIGYVAAARQRHGRAMRRLGALAACLLAVSAVGCITTAVITHIAHRSSKTEHSAIAEIQAGPTDVYNAMLRVVARQPDLEIVKQDDGGRRLDLRKDKSKATAQVRSIGGGRAELKVVAQEDKKEASQQDMAYAIVTQTCVELGVQYRVTEEQ
jgi:hypothetical protein